jgi:hypothetical protein
MHEILADSLGTCTDSVKILLYFVFQAASRPAQLTRKNTSHQGGGLDGEPPIVKLQTEPAAEDVLDCYGHLLSY